MDPEKENSKTSRQSMIGAGIATGVGVSVAIGSAIGNVGAGLGL